MLLNKYKTEEKSWGVEEHSYSSAESDWDRSEAVFG